MKLTPSQCAAIDEQKKLFSKIHPNAEYIIRQPRNTTLIILMSSHLMLNMYGSQLKVSHNWNIGQRGKIELKSVNTHPIFPKN